MCLLLQVPVQYVMNCNDELLGDILPSAYQPSYCYVNFGKDKPWQRYCGLRSIKRSASLIAVQGNLYAAGGLEDVWQSDNDNDEDDSWSEESDSGEYVSMCSRSFSVYKPDSNSWGRLPPMPSARHKMLLVYLNKHLYALGGLDEDGARVFHVERYDFTQKKWKILASLPKGFKWVSAVVFKDKVLVYGVADKAWAMEGESMLRRKQVVVVHNATTDTWQTKLSDEHAESGTESQSSIPAPLLYIYHGTCYRVTYWMEEGRNRCMVNKVELHSRRSSFTIAIGEEVSQEFVPANSFGAFRVDHRVFLNLQGFVYKTDVYIGELQSADVNLNAWKQLAASCYNRCTNIVYFTFDPEKLGRSSYDNVGFY